MTTTLPTRKPLRALLVALAALASLGAARAAEPSVPSPLLGRWAVDTARLPMPPAARPRSVTLTFSVEGTGQLRTRVEVIDAQGGRLEADGVTPLDGRATAQTPSFEADVSATLMPRPDVLVLQLGRDGVPASTRIYTVGPDGHTLTEVVAHFNAQGQPVLRTNHFARIR